MWPVALSGRLPVKALVGHYPTNKLIGRETIPDRKSFPTTRMPGKLNIRDYHLFPSAIPKSRARSSRVTHPFATRVHQKGALPFDLHVLSTPPAFVLSQDQTLRRKTTPTPKPHQNSRTQAPEQKQRETKNPDPIQKPDRITKKVTQKKNQTPTKKISTQSKQKLEARC